MLMPGVQLKQLITHDDERGFFREVIRTSDDFFAEGFAQWSHSKKESGHYEPLFHIHKHQVDWWYVPVGTMRVVLYDMRIGTNDEFQTMLLGESQSGQVLRIPPGVAHNYKVVSDNPAHLMYITSKVYNPEDEGRIELPFDWSTI